MHHECFESNTENITTQFELEPVMYNYISEIQCHGCRYYN